MRARTPALVVSTVLGVALGAGPPAEARSSGGGLKVTALRAPAGALLGSPITVQGAVRNQGDTRRTGRVSLSLRDARGSRSLGTVTIRRLKPGRTARFSKVATVPARLASGVYSVRACVRVGAGAAKCEAISNKITLGAPPGPAGPIGPIGPVVVPPPPASAPTTTGDNVPPVTDPPATVTPPGDPVSPPPVTGPTGTTGGTGSSGSSGPAIEVRDGVTQPVFGFGDAIRQRVWVPIPYDTDGDGTYDRVAVDIKRPKATLNGLKVPIVMDASPYYSTVGRGNEAQLKRVGADGLVDQWPLFLDNYFVPRGYAVALVDTVGTDASTGCPIVGGDADIQGIKRVINWMNGRAKAYSSVSGGTEVPADWTTGKVGMIGKSYDATHANGVAATGVDGLKTIVPVAGISSWYNYYRINGLRFGTAGPSGLSNTVTNPERRAQCAPTRQAIATQAGEGTATTGNQATSGDFTSYWDERNYVANADKVKASVFLVHGVNDDNVKPNNYGDWWNALAANDVPRKIWLSQLGHVDPFDYDRDEWVTTLHRWFDYWLQGVPNGIMDEPMAHIEQQTTATSATGATGVSPVYDEYSSWPDAGAQPTPLYLQATGPTGVTGATGSAGLKPVKYGTTGATGSTGDVLTPSFQDSATQSETQAITNPEVISSTRLVYTSPVLTKDVRISGQSSLQIQATVDQTDTALSALLVDYSTTPYVKVNAASGDGVTNDNPPVKDCVGESDDADSACYLRVHRVYNTTTNELVAHGSIDGRNRDSLRFKSDIGINVPTQFTVPIWADDYVFRAGHRIGVAVEGSDRNYATAKTNRAVITVRIGDSRLTLPVVGGRAALGF